MSRLRSETDTIVEITSVLSNGIDRADMRSPLTELDLDHFHLRQCSCVFKHIEAKLSFAIAGAEVPSAKIPHYVASERASKLP